MIFQFHSKSVTFFEEDKAYFEKRIQPLKKYLGNFSGDEDTLDAKITIEKSKVRSGDRFSAKAHVTGASGGDFYAEATAENIKKCADILKDILKIQFEKFHEKRTQ